MKNRQTYFTWSVYEIIFAETIFLHIETTNCDISNWKFADKFRKTFVGFSFFGRLFFLSFVDIYRFKFWKTWILRMWARIHLTSLSYSFSTARRASKNISACCFLNVRAGLKRIASGPQPPAWIPDRRKFPKTDWVSAIKQIFEPTKKRNF